MTKKINLPITDEDIKSLNAGDSVLLTGTIITGRDAAHKRLFELIEKGEELPVDIKGELIYYVGPAPAKPGFAVGPAGPTSSYRMDKYAPALLDLGLKGMIGKGARNQAVIDSIVKNGLSVRQLEDKIKRLSAVPSEEHEQELPDFYYRVLEHIGRYFGDNISLRRGKSGKGTITIHFNSDAEMEGFLKALDENRK